MSIDITSDLEYHLNRMNRPGQDIEIGTYLKELKSQDYYMYSGVRVSPSVVANDNGTITVGASTYCLFPDASGSSLLGTYTIEGNTFALESNITSYIYVSMASGSPVLGITTDFYGLSGAKFINVIPVFTVYKYGSLVNIIDWDAQGLALGEKLLYRSIDTDRFNRTEGLIISEYGSRNVAISAGTVWYGANKLDVQNFISGSAPSYMYLIAKEGGIWSGSPVTQINNTQYQGTNGLTSIGGSKYTVNWVYRIVSGTERYAVIVLGTSDYTSNQALEAQPPSSLPNIILTQSILVGKIIIQKNASSSYRIDSAFNILFAPTNLDHNLLYNLQGGATDEYYHLSASQISIFNSYTSVVSASANLALNNSNYIILANGSPLITLPTAIGNIGKQYNIKNIGNNTISIIATGSQTIDSASMVLITDKNSSMQVCCDGINWYII